MHKVFLKSVRRCFILWLLFLLELPIFVGISLRIYNPVAVVKNNIGSTLVLPSDLSKYYRYVRLWSLCVLGKTWKAHVYRSYSAHTLPPWASFVIHNTFSLILIRQEKISRYIQYCRRTHLLPRWNLLQKRRNILVLAVRHRLQRWSNDLWIKVILLSSFLDTITKVWGSLLDPRSAPQKHCEDPASHPSGCRQMPGANLLPEWMRLGGVRTGSQVLAARLRAMVSAVPWPGG